MNTIAQKHHHMQTHPLTGARVAHGWSRAQLAELLGVSTRTVVRWESGQTLPYPIYREQLCRLLGLDLADLGLFQQQQVPDTDDVALQPGPLSELPALHDPMIPEISDQVNRFWGRDTVFQQIKQRLFA